MTNWQAPVRQSRPVLTFVGVGLVVVGLVISAFFLQDLLRALPSSPTRVDGRPVTLDGAGLTIFSTTKNATGSCTATDAQGSPIALEKPSRHEQWDAGDALYYVVAHSVAEVPAQTVTVACTDTEAAYFVGRRHTADVFLKPALSALVAFFVPAAIGAGLIAVDQVRRRRRARS
ncbi:hypothetical protein [Kribbella sp. HUAS MG21]|uniref:DUF3592 domain-containing protein n=1 Tax=Kribbella sp. HUAS MG21 TaxID=3160966 RepID=A0AAU7TE79_9ACTN